MTEYTRIESALNAINPTDRDCWVKMGMAVHAALDDKGFDLWDRWSQGAANYDARAARDVWKSFQSGGGITVSTLFNEAKRCGWRKDSTPFQPTAQDRDPRERLAAKRKAREQDEVSHAKRRTTEQAERIWQAATPVPADNPYLTRKGVTPVETLREMPAEEVAKILGYAPKIKGEPLTGRLLIVPVKRDGQLCTLELIDDHGHKSALFGRGTKTGGYWSTALPDTAQTILVGEGVATVLTASLALGHPGAATLSLSNFDKVLQALRQRFPEARLIVLADLVKSTGKPDSRVQKFAKAVGGTVVVPVFSQRQWTDTDFNDLAAREGLQAVQACIAPALETPTPSPFPDEEQRPCFVVIDEDEEQCEEPGVYHCTLRYNPDGKPRLDNTWICSPLHVDAVTLDIHNRNGLLLRFIDRRGNWPQWVMPMDMLRGSGEEMRGALLDMGVRFGSRKLRYLLDDYLLSENPDRHVHAALQTGWVNSSFVLPDKVIGPQSDEIFFQSIHNGYEEHPTAGTLERWKDEIAAKARGNPLFICGLSAGFAGPLMARCHVEGGGIHLVGHSSTGKTTLLEAVRSIWGGTRYRRSWRATANGLEGAACLYNDCLLPLDEISECDPREVGAIVYALANGVGKQRADRSGLARPVTRWRCFVVSTGERSIETVIEEAGQAKAGQTVRLLDVPVCCAHGAWDTLHGSSSPADFSDEIKRAANTHYGHAGRAYLQNLTQDKRNFVELFTLAKAEKGFAVGLNDGQGKRAASYFALLGLAGELATEYGLTGWEKGEAMRAALELFKGWQDMHGKGNKEQRQIAERVCAFLDRFGDGRFSDRNAPDAPVKDRAGWWQEVNNSREYLLMPYALREALKGIDFAHALNVLQAMGALVKLGAGGKRAPTFRIGKREPCRLYVICPEKLMGDE